MYSKPWTITYFYKLMSNWVLDAHPCTLAAIKEYDERINHADNLPGRDYKPRNSAGKTSSTGERQYEIPAGDREFRSIRNHTNYN